MTARLTMKVGGAAVDASASLDVIDPATGVVFA